MHTNTIFFGYTGQGDITTACKRGFLSLDDAMSNETLAKEDSSGCTAVTIIAKGNKFYCVSKLQPEYCKILIYFRIQKWIF